MLPPPTHQSRNINEADLSPACWASGDARASLGPSVWEGLVYRGTVLAIRRERDLLGKSTLCPLAGGSGSINMPPIPPPSSLCWGKVTGSSLHKPDEVETKSGPRLCVRDLKAGAEEQRAVLVRAFCPFPALPLIPQSAGRVKVGITGVPSLQGFQCTWPSWLGLGQKGLRDKDVPRALPVWSSPVWNRREKGCSGWPSWGTQPQSPLICSGERWGFLLCHRSNNKGHADLEQKKG